MSSLTSLVKWVFRMIKHYEDLESWTCEALKSRICEDLVSWTCEALKSRICEVLVSWTCKAPKSRIYEDLKSWTCEASKSRIREDLESGTREALKSWTWEDLEPESVKFGNLLKIRFGGYGAWSQVKDVASKVRAWRVNLWQACKCMRCKRHSCMCSH
jgi:hypothetical protein